MAWKPGLTGSLGHRARALPPIPPVGALGGFLAELQEQAPDGLPWGQGVVDEDHVLVELDRELDARRAEEHGAVRARGTLEAIPEGARQLRVAEIGEPCVEVEEDEQGLPLQGAVPAPARPRGPDPGVREARPA
jgi:hypothetical protein